MRASSACIALALLAGCGPDITPNDGGASDSGPPDAGPRYRAECENINPADCLLPWPSSFFLTDDPSTSTGRRIAIDEAAMPVNVRQRHVNPEQLARFDGFSPDPAIMTVYPGQVDPATLNDEEAIDATLAPASTTLLIDAETGELVPHFAELDQWPETDPERAPLYIRPAVRLAEGHRYVVATHGLKLVGGADIEPSDYFRALRDGTPLQDASDIEDRRAHFDDVFSIIEAAGVPRGELIEAWDFETASGESLWGDLIAMRDDAVGRGDGDFGRAGEDGTHCTVVNVREQADADEHIYRWIEGTVTVPLYLNGTSASSADEASLHRGPDGTPVANGTAEVPFRAQIPLSVATRVAAGGAPGRLEVYGHGLFGSSGEIESGWHRDHQDRLAVVSVAVDWWGMSSDDVPRVTTSLQDFSTFGATSERLHQGVINFLVLTRSFLGTCSELPEMQIELEDGSGTAPAIDTSAAYYYGNSQGGIMGGVVAGVATDIQRFALGVGGMSYPLLIKRSRDWRTFDGLMHISYPDPMIRNLLLAVSSNLWDTAEPSTYAPHLIRDPLPGTPPKHVLMQIGIGDTQVPNVGSALEARTIGIPYVTPSPWEPWGLETTTAPPEDGSALDSALVIYHIPGADPLPAGTREPDTESPAHEGVRRSTAAMDQIDAFWQPDGQITQTCDGICDPT